MYLYILEILGQRLPKACIALSSSWLLIYPRAISSLNLCSRSMDSMVNQYCHAMETDKKEVKDPVYSIRDMRLILKQVTRK
jgi:hypothetical protein